VGTLTLAGSDHIEPTDRPLRAGKSVRGTEIATPEEPRTLDEDNEALFTAMSEMATRRARIPFPGSVALC
jgi:hypothetical protein